MRLHEHRDLADRRRHDLPADALRSASTREYWWRVTANNTCGATPAASTRSAPRRPRRVQHRHDDAGVVQRRCADRRQTVDARRRARAPTPGRSRAAVRSRAPFSWKVVDSAAISDQRLTSPVMTLPVDLGGLNFQFEHWVLVEGSGTDCADGGVLEVAVDGGAFSEGAGRPVPAGGYNGTITGGSGNPLAGTPALVRPCARLRSRHRRRIAVCRTRRAVPVPPRHQQHEPARRLVHRRHQAAGLRQRNVDDRIFADGFDP